ncbi:unnamed protein product [Cuscuta europaea]|nr:unnamed protein product [Cuscuta europaea]
MLGVGPMEAEARYLGLPSLVGRSRREVLGFIKEQVIKRINGWNHKFLSKAGREVLLKTVVQAMPNYAMNVFLFPRDMCMELERPMNGFWWTGASGRGTSWKHWVGMSFPKKKGGMGFKRMREFNLAMLEKQAGRIFKQPDSLVARVLKARYYPCSSFIEAKIGHNPSFVWRSIFETHSLIKQGFMWKMGKGNLINVWRDPWSPCPDNSKVESVVIEGLENCTVAGLLQAGGAARDIDILTDLFNSRDRKLILKIPVSLRRVQGQVIRRWEEDGRYSVRSSYRFLTQNVEDDPLAEKELLHGLQKYDEMELCSSSGSWTGLRASLLISERRIAAESSYANGGYRCWSIKLYGEGGVTHKNQ